MSILVSKMFEADMSEFQFVFSSAACIKTCIYFAVMYILVMFFNTITISRYKLIDLINANKKNEKIKFKNSFLAILVFIVSISILSYAYWKVTKGATTMKTENEILPPILMGIIATIGIFWSLSGFILTIIKKIKQVYLKDTNMFVLRQINSKINTTVISMSVICLMLFLTISILSTSLGLKNTMQREMIEMTPVDINLEKIANLPDSYIDSKGNTHTYYKNVVEDSKIPISETLKNNGLDINVLKDVVETPIYEIEDLTIAKFLEPNFKEINEKFPFLLYKTKEKIMKISDYNKIAKLYGIEEYNVNDNEYIMVCDFDNMINIRNKVLSNRNKLEIAGKEYISKYTECKRGFIQINSSHTNTGILLVPDNCNLTEEMKEKYFLAANYNANTEEEKQNIEEIFIDDSSLIKSLNDNCIEIDGMSKISLIESSKGLTTIITFISIYLGIIFLIASSAILALKQLTESADNKQRYIILRKIGCDEKMINRALFRQIGIFFMLPLLLATIHSIFGIQFALQILSGIAKSQDLLPSIIATAITIGTIYGAYFLTTYMGSKNIIKEE